MNKSQIAKLEKNVNEKLSELTFGSDPELFLADNKGNIKSSIPILKRDKHNPIVLDKNRKIALFADNSLGEFSFAPSKTKEEFINQYRTAFKKGQEYVGNKYRFLVKSAHTFKDNELEAAFGIDPSQIGCNPEYDFYEVKMKDLGEFENNMRSGSSHLHIGHNDLTNFDKRHEALRTLEIFLGSSSVIWDNDPSSLERRQKYGRSGSFRPTDYGFETRFMSNYMLHSPKLVDLTYDLIKYSLGHVFRGSHKEILKSINEKDVQNAINHCDKKLAHKILVKAELPEPLMERVYAKQKPYNFHKDWEI